MFPISIGKSFSCPRKRHAKKKSPNVWEGNGVVCVLYAQNEKSYKLLRLSFYDHSGIRIVAPILFYKSFPFFSLAFHISHFTFWWPLVSLKCMNSKWKMGPKF